MNITFTSFDRYLAIVAKSLALGGVPSNSFSQAEAKAAFEEGVLPTALASYFRDRYLDLEISEDFSILAT